eukprot:CAMPEP_0182420394 /NCGR_PEP_ID=MMETSP1167-20130531/5155_1 /TAXON_ID=2988 /ORGANISM="Mallomonas Sp, Strain CCMP3275" /LENGTH=157 /DNA_ID=CAMNT_0024596277 /DNA_START=158 /DNA_END=628 /DNA_ORIENTATION=+
MKILRGGEVMTHSALTSPSVSVPVTSTSLSPPLSSSLLSPLLSSLGVSWIITQLYRVHHEEQYPLCAVKSASVLLRERERERERGLSHMDTRDCYAFRGYSGVITVRWRGRTVNIHEVEFTYIPPPIPIMSEMRCHPPRRVVLLGWIHPPFTTHTIW